MKITWDDEPASVTPAQPTTRITWDAPAAPKTPIKWDDAPTSVSKIGGTVGQAPPAWTGRPISEDKSIPRAVAEGMAQGVGQMVSAVANIPSAIYNAQDPVDVWLSKKIWPAEWNRPPVGSEAVAAVTRPMADVGQQIQDATKPTTGTFEPTNPRWYAERGSALVPQLAAQAGAALATRGASIPAQVAAFTAPAAAQTVGSTYGDAVARGTEPGSASTQALATGAVVSALEAIPGMAFLSARIPTLPSIVQKIAASRAGRAGLTGAAEGATEGAQEVAQMAIQYVAEHDPAAFSEWQARTAGAAVLGGVAGGALGAVSPGPTKQVSNENVVQTVQGDVRQGIQTEENGAGAPQAAPQGQGQVAQPPPGLPADYQIPGQQPMPTARLPRANAATEAVGQPPAAGSPLIEDVRQKQSEQMIQQVRDANQAGAAEVRPLENRQRVAQAAPAQAPGRGVAEPANVPPVAATVPPVVQPQGVETELVARNVGSGPAQDAAQVKPQNIRAVSPDELPDANTANTKTWYHGSGSKGLTADSLDTIGNGEPNGLFGMGLYTTDSKETAESYSKVRSKKSKTPATYEVKTALRPDSVVNFDKPVDQRVLAAIKKGAYSDFHEAIDAAAQKPGATGASVWKAMTEAVEEQSQGDQVPISEYYEMFQGIQSSLRESGIDAITHVGGLRAGKGGNQHQVLILLDPNDVATGTMPKSVASMAEVTAQQEPPNAQAQAPAAPQPAVPADAASDTKVDDAYRRDVLYKTLKRDKLLGLPLWRWNYGPDKLVLNVAGNSFMSGHARGPLFKFSLENALGRPIEEYREGYVVTHAEAKMLGLDQKDGHNLSAATFKTSPSPAPQQPPAAPAPTPAVQPAQGVVNQVRQKVEKKAGTQKAPRVRSASDILLERGTEDGLFPNDYEQTGDARPAVDKDVAAGVSASERQGMRQVVDEGRASDATASMTAAQKARYERGVQMRFGANKAKRVAQAIAHYKGHPDPNMRLMAVQAEAEGQSPTQQVKAKTFSHGDKFKIGDRPFRVEVDADGNMHFLDGDVDIPYVEPGQQVKIAKGSHEQAPEPEVPEGDFRPISEGDTEEARTPLTGGQINLAGEVEPSTVAGKQTSMFGRIGGGPTAPSSVEAKGNNVGQSAKDNETTEMFGEMELSAGIPIPKVLEELRLNPLSPFRYLISETAAPLKKNAPGRNAYRGMDEAATAADNLTGQIENDAHDAMKGLKHSDRKWLDEHDPLGYANYQKMREDTPSGRLAAPNPALAAIDAVTQKAMDITGDEAERVKLPLSTGGTFHKAKSGRFIRHWTPEFMESVQNGSGPLLDAYEKAVIRDNPGVTPQMVKDTLEAMRSPDPIRHNRALETLRTIKNVPAYVEVNGEWVQIMETDPYRVLLSGTRSMAQRIYFYEKVGSDEDVAKLRAQFVEQGGTRKEFDDAVAAANGRKIGPTFDPQSGWVRVMRAANTLIGTTQLSGRALVNLGQTVMLVPTYTGGANYLKGVATAVRHPRMTLARLAAMGAMHRSIMETTVQEGRRLESYTRIFKGAVDRVTLAHFTDQMNNAIAGAAFEELAKSWRRNGLKAGDLYMAKEMLALTPREIALARQGNISQKVLQKIVQNGIKRTQFVTESPHRTSKFQHNEIAQAIVSYQSYAIGTMRAVGRILDEAKVAVESGDKARMAGAGKRMLGLLAGSIGAGTVSIIAKSFLYDRPIKKEDETWPEFAMRAMLEAGLYGPAQRAYDAFRYNTGEPERQILSLLPKAAFIIEVAKALNGIGPYAGQTKGESFNEFLTRNMPAARAINNATGEPLTPKFDKMAKDRAPKTAAERMARELGYKSATPPTREDRERNARRQQIVDARRSGNIEEYRRLLMDPATTPKDRDNVRERLRLPDDFAYRLTNLSAENAVKVYGAMNAQEKEKYRQIIRRMVGNSELPGTRKRELQQALN